MVGWSERDVKCEYKAIESDALLAYVGGQASRGFCGRISDKQNALYIPFYFSLLHN